MVLTTRLCSSLIGNSHVQVLAAQWVNDAVIAYNALIEHVCTLPQQPSHPGMACKLLQLESSATT